MVNNKVKSISRVLLKDALSHKTIATLKKSIVQPPANKIMGNKLQIKKRRSMMTAA